MTDCIELPISALRQAVKAASTEETRYYLEGVCLDRAADGALLLVATDGCVLSIRRVPDAACPAGLVGRIVEARAIEALTGKDDEDWGDSTVRISAEAGGTIARGRLVISGAFIDGTFPDWRKVVPKSPSLARPAGYFDARIVAKLLRAAGNAPVWLFGHDEAEPEIGPHLARTDDPDWLGVVMPFSPALAAPYKGRLDLPEWLVAP